MSTSTSTRARNVEGGQPGGDRHHDAGLVPRRHHIDRRAGKLAAEIAAGGDPDQLLSDHELSELTGLSRQWFTVARVRGFAPPFVRLSPRVVRTRRSDYVAWLEERTHLRTAEYADADAPYRGRQKGSRVIDGKVIPPAQED
jgi:predicted DNA-binding transcriptional regulator AlpA